MTETKQERRNRLLSTYNLDINSYNKLLSKQNNKCAICGSLDSGQYNQYGKCPFPVDHNHKSGKVRGLLCTNCNTILGMANDNPYISIKAMRYLSK